MDNKNVFPEFRLAGSSHSIAGRTGLSKRELFAIMVLQGAVANSNSYFFGSTTKDKPELPEWVFINAVKAADALIKELESPKDG